MKLSCLPKISAIRRWSPKSVMEACQRNNLYTCGENRSYRCMLDAVFFSEPTYDNLYRIASDIKKHSENQSITSVMSILEKEAVKTVFVVEEEENGN